MLLELIQNAFFAAMLFFGPMAQTPDTIPQVEVVSWQQGQEEGGGFPVRALYDPEEQVIYIVLEDEDGRKPTQVELFLSLTHEMVHHIQNVNGQLVRKADIAKMGRADFCMARHLSEMNALDIEDELGKYYQRPKQERFGYYIAYGFCLDPHGGM